MANLENMSVTELEGKKKSLALLQMGISSVGMVGGMIYANRKGKKFWGYVGYGILGGIAAGSIAYFTTFQRINKINTVIKQKKGL